MDNTYSSTVLKDQGGIMNKIFSILFTLALAMGIQVAIAGELDNDSQVSNQGQSLNGTVIVRIDHETNTTAIAHTEAAFKSNDEAQTFVNNSEFQVIPQNHIKKSELDNDGGASSWYYYSPYSYYPYGGYYSNYFYYYGNYYSPCYNYSYGRYSYYYYSNNYWGW